MNDINEYEQRLAAALERIRSALDTLGSQGETGGEDAAALRDALEAERAANAQLSERVRAIKDKQETMVGTLERNLAKLTQQIEAQGRELARQKRVNAELTETNAALADAARRGMVEPHLLNRAMLSELEALRAARASEVAELDGILSELKPLIGEVA